MHDLGAGGGQHSLRELREYDLEKRMRAIELQQATLMHLPDDVRKLADAVQGMASKLPAAQGVNNDVLAQAINAQSLAMQRMFDTMSKTAPPATTTAELLKLLNTQPPGTSGKTWALVGMLATVAAFLAYRAFAG